MQRTKSQVLVVAFLYAAVCSYVQCGYVSVGCFKDTGSRAIPTSEGLSSILDGSYTQRVSPSVKCAVAALTWGYNMFAVQNGGQCFGSATAPLTFDKYGISRACWNGGEGGAWANQVYVIKGYVSIGCYNDKASRAIPILEGQDSILDEYYTQRLNPIAKCAVAAMRRGYHMFAVQNSGQCFGSATAPLTLTSMENLQLVGMVAKEDPGQMKFILLPEMIDWYFDTTVGQAIKIFFRVVYSCVVCVLFRFIK